MGSSSSRPRRNHDRLDEEAAEAQAQQAQQPQQPAQPAQPQQPQNPYPANRPNPAAANRPPNMPFIPAAGMYYGPHYIPGGQPFYVGNDPFALGGFGRDLPFGSPYGPPQPQARIHNTKTIKSDINLKKDSVRVIQSPDNPNIISFQLILDLNARAVLSVYYFAKEDSSPNSTTYIPEDESQVHRYPTEIGLNQEFRIPFEHAIDTTAVDPSKLTKAVAGERVPVILVLEPTNLTESERGSTVRSQTTFVSFVQSTSRPYDAKVMKQEIRVGENVYVLHEIYGIDQTPSSPDSDDGKECVVCMTNKRTTAVLPCRHMCLCDLCVEDFRKQTNKCPICRSGIRSYLVVRGESESQPTEV